MGERIVVLNAGLRLAQTIEVAGWRLEKPASAEFDRLAPAGRETSVWDDGTRSGRCCVLRRADPSITVPRGLRLPRGLAEELSLTELPLEYWQPLLLLNLNASGDRVGAVAEYDVVPGQFVQRARGDGPVMVPTSPDGEEEPLLGPLSLNADATAELVRTASILAEYFPTSDVFVRSARHFLDVGPMLGSGGDVTRPSNRGTVMFRYVMALELLLSTRGDYGRRRQAVSQRTAVLLEADEQRQQQVFDDVQVAYEARNFEAHGGGPRIEVTKDLPIRMRDHVRRVLCRLLVLGPEFDAPSVCQQAAEDPHRRGRDIDHPIRVALDRLD